MSTPIIELIAEDIKDTINAITVSGGFNQDLVAVRPKTVDFKNITPENGKVLIVQASEEDREAEPLGHQEWFQPFVLSAIVTNSEDSSVSLDTKINQVVSDIRKKILEDPYRGGLAVDTEIKPAILFSDGEDVSGANVVIVVHYRTDYSDPYSQ